MLRRKHEMSSIYKHTRIYVISQEVSLITDISKNYEGACVAFISAAASDNFSWTYMSFIIHPGARTKVMRNRQSQ